MSLTRVACPKCRAVLKPSKLVPEGARIKCPKCQSAFVAAGESEPEETLDEVEDEREDDAEELPEEAEAAVQTKPRRTRAEDDVPRPRKKEGRVHDDEDDRPWKKTRKKKGGGAGIWIGVACGALVLVGGGIAAVVYFMNRPGGGTDGGAGGQTANSSGTAAPPAGSSMGGPSEPGANVGGTVVTVANYDRIRPDMAQAQVIQIMGDPNSRSVVNAGLGPNDVLKWTNGPDYIMVSFQRDRPDGRAIGRPCDIQNSVPNLKDAIADHAHFAWDRPGFNPSPGSSGATGPNQPTTNPGGSIPTGPGGRPAPAGNSAVSLANYKRIQRGMTLDQIVAFMGPPINTLDRDDKHLVGWQAAGSADFMTIAFSLKDGSLVWKYIRVGYGTPSVTELDTSKGDAW